MNVIDALQGQAWFFVRALFWWSSSDVPGLDMP